MENKVNNFEAIMNASGLTDSVINIAGKSWRNHASKTINGYDVEYYKGKKNKHMFFQNAVGYVQEADKIMKLSFQKNNKESLKVVAHECFHMEEYYSRKNPMPGPYNILYSKIQNVGAKNKWATINGSRTNIVFEGTDEELFECILYPLLPRELKANLFSIWKMGISFDTLSTVLANESAIDHMKTRMTNWKEEEIYDWWNKRFTAITHYEAMLVLDNLLFNVWTLGEIKHCQTMEELAVLFDKIDAKQCEILKKTITF